MFLKTLFIVIPIGAIAAVHLLHPGSHTGFHIVNQQLFFIPLVLASFWFGARAGLATAVAVSFLYGPSMLFRHHEEGRFLVVFTQVSLYLSIAYLMGWLSDRQRRQQQQLLKNERINALGKAASTVGVEIRDIVREVESIYNRSGGLKNEEADDGFQNEMNRLKRMVDELGLFATSSEHVSLSSDLNDILWHSLGKYRPEALDKGLKITIQPNETGCRSTVPVESISRIFDALVDNAIDFSQPGQAIVLRSFGGEGQWILEVADLGTGVAKENAEKLFTAFFTTRPDGYGLSLSSGRKLLRDLGGDLVYAPGDNGGAIFRMLIPRQPPGEGNKGIASQSV
ncbi:MAG: Histidine kinase [uncultured bacterium]|nr:MAG: Histidine kinase [uncultured bacterium]